MENPADFMPTIIPPPPPLSRPAQPKPSPPKGPVRDKRPRVKPVEAATAKTETTIPVPPLKRSDTFQTKIDSPRREPVDVIPSPSMQRSETFTNESKRPPSSTEERPGSRSTSELSITIPIDSPTFERTETISREAPIEIKQPVTPVSSFLSQAREWARRTHDLTYTNLVTLNDEATEHRPIRRSGASLRKLPEVDPATLTRLIKNRSPNEVTIQPPTSLPSHPFLVDPLSAGRAASHSLFPIVDQHHLCKLDSSDSSSMQTRPTCRSRFLPVSIHSRHRGTSLVLFITQPTSSLLQKLEQLA